MLGFNENSLICILQKNENNEWDDKNEVLTENGLATIF